MTNDRAITKSASGRRGFTLIELLVVIGIIALLASLVLAVSATVIRTSEERSTRNTLEVLNAAVEEYERSAERRVTYKAGAYTGGPAADANAAPGFRYDVEYNTTPTAAAPVPGSGPAAADLVTTWGVLAPPYGGLAGGGLPAYSSSAFRRTAYLMALLAAHPGAGAVLQKLPDSVFRYVNASAGNTRRLVRHAVDSWDTPIIAIFPGRDASQTEIASTPQFVDKDGTVRSDSERATALNGGLGVSCRDRRVLFVSAGNDSRFNDAPVGGVYKVSNDNLYSYDPDTAP